MTHLSRHAELRAVLAKSNHEPPQVTWSHGHLNHVFSPDHHRLIQPQVPQSHPSSVAVYLGVYLQLHLSRSVGRRGPGQESRIRHEFQADRAARIAAITGPSTIDILSIIALLTSFISLC
jgi:hypothetical protein